MEVRLDTKADQNEVSRLEVQIGSFDKRFTTIETAVQSVSATKKTEEDMVKDCVEKVLKAKKDDDEEEKAERDRRKTSVIIHGVKESDCDQPKDREDEDLRVLAAMLHEMRFDDDEVKIAKVIRLEKRSADQAVKQSQDQ